MASALKKSIELTSQDFTEEEVKSRIGRAVCLMAELDVLHPGLTGRVVDYHQEAAKDEFEVVVRFDLRNGFEPVYDLFGKARYARFLRDV